jgi:class 3 adenylate cyclase
MGSHLLSHVEGAVDDLIEYVDEKVVVERRSEIPEDFPGPSRSPNKWLEIPNVSCVYVDMVGSTEISRFCKDEVMGRIYQAFTGGAVKIFHELDARYIDVRGDGAFALFNETEVYRALVAAVSVKTYFGSYLAPKIKTKHGLAIDAHLGIHRGDVLVRKVGIERRGAASERHNEVWAADTVSTASKLASLGHGDRLLASLADYEQLTDKKATHSCTCGRDPDGNPTTTDGPSNRLWKPLNLTDLRQIQFVPDLPGEEVMVLEVSWCKVHGREYAGALLKADR